MQQAGFDANTATSEFVGGIYPTARRYCHREYGYRPDIKALGSYPLPGGVQFSATYQFIRGVQTGGAGPSILGTWTMTNATLAGERFDARTQPERGLDLQVGPAHSRRPRLRRPEPAPARSAREQALHGRALPLPLDFDLYNALNSNWPYTVSTTFSTSATASTWLRPTRALDGRMFKIGGQFDF